MDSFYIFFTKILINEPHVFLNYVLQFIEIKKASISDISKNTKSILSVSLFSA